MKIEPLRKHKKSLIVQIKVSWPELKALRVKANEYADGNVSAWIRYASITLEPRSEHLSQDGQQNG